MISERDKAFFLEGIAIIRGLQCHKCDDEAEHLMGVLYEALRGGGGSKLPTVEVRHNAHEEISTLIHAVREGEDR